MFPPPPTKGDVGVSINALKRAFLNGKLEGSSGDQSWRLASGFLMGSDVGLLIPITESGEMRKGAEKLVLNGGETESGV
ncbi:MAG: hypothetical protein MK106_15280 [Mariniblastus sp.]|nr:hypothetical protein [Mariniblastus sp.]